MKICAACQVSKSEKDFSPHGPSRPGLLRRNCKKCCYLLQDRTSATARVLKYSRQNRKKIAARQLARHYKNPERAAEIARKSKYGVTPEVWKKLVTEQKGCCALCELPKSLCVDHNHVTGKVRGLLCQNCNRALGMIKDSWATAQAAADYLKKHS